MDYNKGLNKEEKSDFQRLFGFIKFHCLKITVLIVIIICIICLLNYFEIIQTEEQQHISFYVNQTKSFKGYRPNDPESNLTVANSTPTLKESLHFIVYGKTGSGKTTFIKKYIENNFNDKNVYIFCKQKEEWMGYKNVYTNEDLEMLKDMDNFKGSEHSKNLLLLDDMGNLIKQKDVSEIFTKGRHSHIQIIVLAHKACDVDNKIRENIDVFYTTTRNNQLFFDDLNRNYSLDFNLRKYYYVEFGIIRLDLIMGSYKVYDKDMNMLVDSQNQIYNIQKDFDIKKYAHKKVLTQHDTENIIIFLEERSIDKIYIIPETFYFYYDYYLNKVLNIKTPMRLKNKETLTSFKYYISNFREGFITLKPVINDIKGL